MGTFLFDDIIFGPVKSRRLGASLGVNLLPVNRKFCNFDCIYCECGWNGTAGEKQPLPSRDELARRLEERILEILKNGTPLDRITFAGNGEPTMHPDFPGIIDDTLRIRDRLVPGVLVAVLSNAARLESPGVFEALGRVDQNILKLDSADERTVRLINRPPAGYSVEKVIGGMMRYQGRFVLQTLFLHGEIDGIPVDNASEQEIGPWLEIVGKVRPSMVMIYTIARDTPVDTLHKTEPEILDRIAQRVRDLGIEVQVSY